MKRLPGGVVPSEITAREVFMSRRSLLAGAVATGAIGAGAAALLPRSGARANELPAAELKYTLNRRYSDSETPNTFADITNYNNFYEFGTGKSDPAANAYTLHPHPWSVTVAGEAEKTGTFHLEDLLRPFPLEERIYRFRCVEAWSMVVPWVGFPLGSLLNRFKPTSRAKYVAFTTLYDTKQMPGERDPILDWPYVEGLRMDEAMNPLAMLVVGVYGQVLPNQNGAPLRLIVPWKYGFKGIKSIVKITFVEEQPRTAWSEAAPNEYGFYANVNPHVDHPRWSQASERRIGHGFFSRQPTLMFNGYESEVAYLYRGMDLRRYF
ncbi:MAG TPA: protein-methionine-sulfoxide reductase catalytic subunit MsrP [Steroidobacteraceae bacterium]|nr:protein-methionine-sulfoxide reductase catalytic subunit MsrP [Steroidobacteraceae bacterium]